MRNSSSSGANATGGVQSDASSFGLAACSADADAQCMEPPQVWLQPLDSGETKSTEWQQLPHPSRLNLPDKGEGEGGAMAIKNVGNGHCLAACSGRQYPPQPPAPIMATCAEGSPSKNSAWCDETASFEARATALVANLSMVEKSVLWTVTGSVLDNSYRTNYAVQEPPFCRGSARGH